MGFKKTGDVSRDYTNVKAQKESDGRKVKSSETKEKTDLQKQKASSDLTKNK